MLRSAAVASVSALAAGAGCRVWGNADVPPSGDHKLLVTLQLDGGADVTQLCDPKVNVQGEPKINHWADSLDPGSTGTIQFAPVADNEWLFHTFGRDMLVINGVDSQTNSHETGRLFNWTGSNAEGLPSLTALHAASLGADLPLAYTVFGGHSRTHGLVTYNRFDDISRISSLVQPNVDSWSGEEKRNNRELKAAQQLVEERVNRVFSSDGLTPRQKQSLLRYEDGVYGREGLRALADILPGQDEFAPGVEFYGGGYNFWSNLKQQIQGAMLIFKSGLGVSADLALNGFDTHEQHDEAHEALLFHLADVLEFFWDYAEQQGLAERITLVIGTDFGRTNYYNDGNGKDHWPIGSYIIMERNAPWGNRVVGATDELHFAKAVDPKTLKENRNGVVLTPAHVHAALRDHLGLSAIAEESGFGLNQAEVLPLFDPFLGS